MGSPSNNAKRAAARAVVVLVAAGALIPAAAGAGAAGVIPAAKTFAPTGAEQLYTVPKGVTLVETDLNGGSGGGGAYGMPLGGYLPVTSGEKLYVEVGVNGDYAGGPTFGGGGAAGPTLLALGAGGCTGLDATGSCGGALAGSGGGASDIRTCSEHASKCPGSGSSEASRLEVAGGGGGQGGDGATQGWYCTELPQKGYGYNPQPLPKGNPTQGPVPIRTRLGIVIPGEPADHTYGGPIKDISASQGGSTTPGAGGTLGSCSVQEVNNGSILADTWSGSIPGPAGSGANGGTGAAVTGHFGFEPGGWIPGSGGGGGGGYTGGGGGSTGSVCTYSVKGTPCYNPSGGMGGGGGSSFAARRIIQPFVQDGPASGPSITMTPIVEIDSPKNGAVYHVGQVVTAKWECGHYQGTECEGATAPSGSRIATTRGKHTFSVKVGLSPSPQVASSTVTYTVR